MKMKAHEVLTILIVAIFILGVCLFFIINIIKSGETPFSEFKNSTQLMNSESWLRGWTPDIIPTSATDIYEAHNLDTNWVKLKFSFAEEDKFYDADTFIPIEFNDEVKNCLYEDFVWWNLRDVIENCELYKWNGKTQNAEVNAIWAIDTKNSIAYYCD